MIYATVWLICAAFWVYVGCLALLFIAGYTQEALYNLGKWWDRWKNRDLMTLLRR